MLKSCRGLWDCYSHMSLSLMIPQKYCGFSTKLDMPESSVLSSEDGGLTPKFIKRRDTARSSSVPRTDEPEKTQKMIYLLTNSTGFTVETK